MAKARQTNSGELLIIPDPFVPKACLLFSRNPATGQMGILYSQDGGTTFTFFVPAPTGQNRSGQVLTLQPDLSAAWQLPSAPPPTPSTAKIPIYVEMQQVGSLAAGQVFGYLKISTGKPLFLQEIQLCMQNAADNVLQVDVLNGAGVAQGRVATIGANATKGSTVLTAGLRMPAGTVWSLKVLQAGSSGAPGENLTARLVFALG